MAMTVFRRPRRRATALLMISLLVGACATAADQQAAATSTSAVAATTVPTTVTTTASTTTTTTTTTTTAPPQPLVIHGAGDLNVDPSYIPALATEGYGHALSGLDGLFTTDDLTVVNLECAPSNLGVRQPRPFNFRCDPDALPVLAADGVDVASLGNNHSMDYGPEALIDSVANVRAAGIAVVGAGANRTDAFAPAIIERGGRSIAVLGFGAVYLGHDWVATEDRPGISDGLDLPAMVDAVETAATAADVVIVTIHWCCELELTPNARNRDHAAALIEAGATVIFGHHHHRIQPMEIVDGSAVAWGLGNFVWPRFSRAGSDTAVARVVITADGDVIGCLLPVTIVSSGHPVLDDPSITTCPDEPKAVGG